MLLTALMTVFSINTVLPNTVHTQQAIEPQTTLIISDTDNNKPQWAKLCQTYAASLVSGGLIGSITGGLSSYAAYLALGTFGDKGMDIPGAYIITFIAILCAEHNLRNRLVKGVDDSFTDNAIPHKKQLTDDTAWIASWIGFFAAASKLPFKNLA